MLERLNKIVAASVAALGIATAANAAVHDVMQQGFTFVPGDLEVVAGDTIRWHWSAGLHTVTSGTDCTYDGIHFNEPLDADHPIVEYVVPGNFDGVIGYFCEFHCAIYDMVGSITVTPATGTIHEVMQDGLTFLPDEVTAEPGDTIRWLWSAGAHTVTSGLGCTPDGKYFDEPLDSEHTVVEYTIPDEITGEIPYFCIPHCPFEMTGVIIVPQPCDADLTDDGQINVFDLLNLLEAWGDCPGCPADLNGDDVVNVFDLLALLEGWGPC
jgi:plastocyanin